MVTPSATSPALTDGKNYEFIFRTIGRDDQQPGRQVRPGKAQAEEGRRAA